MEARNGTAGHCDEHHGPLRRASGMHSGKTGRTELGHVRAAGDQRCAANADGHDDQADTKDGIELANDLVNGQEGRRKIVQKHNRQPEGAVKRIGGQPCQ